MLFETEASQKKLCSALRTICLFSTIGMAIYFIVAIWMDNSNSVVFAKVLFSYGIIMISSFIIQKIYTDPKPKKHD